MIGKVLAVDYGARRTGLAVCDALGMVAHPLPLIDSTDLDETVGAIVATVKEKEVRTVLVGMPYLLSGQEGAQVARVRHFMTSLKAALPEGTVMVDRDERFTTSEAEQLWRQAGVRRKDAKPYIDSTAAVILLRQFLEENQDGAQGLE